MVASGPRKMSIRARSPVVKARDMLAIAVQMAVRSAGEPPGRAVVADGAGMADSLSVRARCGPGGGTRVRGTGCGSEAGGGSVKLRHSVELRKGAKAPGQGPREKSGRVKAAGDSSGGQLRVLAVAAVEGERHA